MQLSKKLLRLVMQSHFLPRAEYDNVRKMIDVLDPFLMLTERKFASNMANQIVKTSKHEAIDRELQLITTQMERAARSVDDVKRLLGIKNRWRRDDTEYVKILEYISNRKFVCVIEELQGLVVSRLMELDKVNLAGSGRWYSFMFLRIL